MLKFSPILYSPVMIEARYNGRKRQTRRLNGLDIVNKDPDRWSFQEFSPLVPLHAVFKHEDWDGKISVVKAPYGEIGTILWARESWKITGWSFEDGEMYVEYTIGSGSNCNMHDPTEDCQWMIDKISMMEKKGYIKLSDPNDEESSYDFTDKPLPFSPNIHMPKEAARFFDRITGYRIERLHSITEKDVTAEGSGRDVRQFALFGLDQNGRNEVYKRSFQRLWESINGKESWIKNPWVWVVDFEPVEISEEDKKMFFYNW